MALDSQIYRKNKDSGTRKPVIKKQSRQIMKNTTLSLCMNFTVAVLTSEADSVFAQSDMG